MLYKLSDLCHYNSTKIMLYNIFNLFLFALNLLLSQIQLMLFSTFSYYLSKCLRLQIKLLHKYYKAVFVKGYTYKVVLKCSSNKGQHISLQQTSLQQTIVNAYNTYKGHIASVITQERDSLNTNQTFLYINSLYSFNHKY